MERDRPVCRSTSGSRQIVVVVIIISVNIRVRLPRYAQILGRLTEKPFNLRSDFRKDVRSSDARRRVAEPWATVRLQPRSLGAALGATALPREQKVSNNQLDTSLVRWYPSPPNKETPLHGAFFVWRRCVVEAPKVVHKTAKAVLDADKSTGQSIWTTERSDVARRARCRMHLVNAPRRGEDRPRAIRINSTHHHQSQI